MRQRHRQRSKLPLLPPHPALPSFFWGSAGYRRSVAFPRHLRCFLQSFVDVIMQKQARPTHTSPLWAAHTNACVRSRPLLHKTHARLASVNTVSFLSCALKLLATSSLPRFTSDVPKIFPVTPIYQLGKKVHSHLASQTLAIGLRCDVLVSGTKDYFPIIEYFGSE